MNAGYTWVVDIDLEKYFDTVNHDKLMDLVLRRVQDKRVLKLIRAYLNSGVMINGVVTRTEKGCPQGGLLSPLLSNIMLDELDKEIERRNHKFCRYADDNQLYVKSKKAAERVMQGVTDYIEKKLKLKVNRKKSAIARPWQRNKTRFRMLRKLGIKKSKAWEYANTRKGYWRISNSPILKRTFTNQSLKKMGYFSFMERYAQVINS